MLRRNFLLAGVGLATLALAGCNPSDPTVTLDDVVKQIRDKCAFQADWKAIAAVVATVVSGFNAAAGATTTIAVGVANTVIGLICGAVEQKLASLPPNTKAASPTITVTVNGVDVTGTYIGK